MKKISAGKGLFIDSAGTAGYHIGDLPDARMRSHAQKRGYILDSRARQFDADSDFESFDHIIAMDKSNLRDLQALDRKKQYSRKLSLMGEYCSSMIEEVPDPYYGGPEGFDYVLDILEDACSGLLKRVTDGPQ